MNIDSLSKSKLLKISIDIDRFKCLIYLFYLLCNFKGFSQNICNSPCITRSIEFLNSDSFKVNVCELCLTNNIKPPVYYVINKYSGDSIMVTDISTFNRISFKGLSDIEKAITFIRLQTPRQYLVLYLPKSDSIHISKVIQKEFFIFLVNNKAYFKEKRNKLKSYIYFEKRLDKKVYYLEFDLDVNSNIVDYREKKLRKGTILISRKTRKGYEIGDIFWDFTSD